jgi:glycosyltransferase involved in cell wall biosynthesis
MTTGTPSIAASHPRIAARDRRIAVIRPSIAVILPAYNEELTIRETIDAFHRAVPEARLVIINNASNDRTAEIAEQTLRDLDCDGQVINETRPGKGNAVRRGFIDVNADVYVLVDADMTYPAHRVRDLLRPVLDNQADMVVGDRISNGDYRKENHRPLHNFGNRLVQGLVNELFRARLVDIMSGYRVMSRRLVKNYPILVEGFQIETDLTLHALDKRFRIVEIPIEYKDRPAGSFSKLNTLSDGARVLWLITQILRHYRPLQFFFILFLLSALAGVISSIPVMHDWLVYRFIYHVPLAILATGLEILAVVFIAIGLILDSLVHLQRLAYERDILNSPARDRRRRRRS